MFSSEYSEIFMNTYIEEHLRTDALETSFPRTKKLFFETLGYRFIVESITIENAKLSYKTALPKANVETNIMGSTKWEVQNGLITKNEVLPPIALFFRKLYLTIRISYK